MTDKEALKLALEALEYIDDGANNQGTHTGISWRCVSTKAESAIAALKERLAQSEQEHVAWNTGIPPLYPKMKEGETISVEYVELTPPQRTEQNFCPRCGKRTKDIHTCTPPKENT